MHTHLVIFISCDPPDLVSGQVFERAAEFTRYECSIEIRCSDGRELHVTCSPTGPTCWGWRYFRDQWVRRHGFA